MRYKNNKGGITEITANRQTNEIKGFNIYLPVNQFDGKLSLYSIENALHETFHFNSHISNPKHTARCAKMYETGLSHRTEGFYTENLYSKDKKFNIKSAKNSLNRFLEKFTPDEQINFLQNSRYRLWEEMQAFKEGAKYLKKIQNIHHNDKIQEKISPMNTEDYHFQKKIEMLKDKLKEVLFKYRLNKICL